MQRIIHLIRTAMLGTMLFGAALAAGGHTAAAEDAGAQSAAQTIIQGQLDAMAAGDKAKAYSYAAPIIQQRFTNPDVFMQMVTTGYGALIGPQAVEFERYEIRGDRAVQSVRILAQDGTAWRAHYLMKRMEDGSWRIAGCELEKLPGGSV